MPNNAVPYPTFVAQRLTDETFSLAEGPVWLPSRDSFLFVDINGKAISELTREKTETETSYTVRRYPVADRVGFIVPIDAYCVMAGVRDTLMVMDLDSGDEATPYLSLNLPETHRFNDGKCGPSGTLYAGVMPIHPDDPAMKGTGKLYVIRGKKVIQTIDNLTIPNGMAWTHDGKTMYHTDTPSGKILRYTVAPDGTLSNPQLAVQINHADGSPDGLCIDDDGNLWVALWGGRKVQAYDPEGGNIIARIDVDAENVSCPTFGGIERNQLLITSGSSDSESGKIFTVELPVKGPAPYCFPLSE